MRKDCAAGARLVLGTPTDLAALRRSFLPVYRKLEQDPRTKSLINRIERLKQSTGRDPALPIPTGCSSG